MKICETLIGDCVRYCPHRTLRKCGRRKISSYFFGQVHGAVLARKSALTEDLLRGGVYVLDEFITIQITQKSIYEKKSNYINVNSGNKNKEVRKQSKKK